MTAIEVYEYIASRIGYIISSDKSRYAWNYLLASYVFAYVYYLWKRKKSGSFLTDAFGQKSWWTKSSLVDLLFFLFFILEISKLFVGITTREFINNLEKFFITSEEGLFPHAFDIGFVKWSWFVFAVFIFDLGLYIGHRWSHRIPWMWCFHEPHHTAQSLNVLTSLRVHPIERLIIRGFPIFLTGGFLWCSVALFGQKAIPMITFSVPSYFFFRVLIGNLHHTHIKMHFPKWLSHVLVSPVMHQVHHSTERKHFDKNFGFLISLYDWWFGTLYIPTEKEIDEINFGPSTDSKINPNSIVSCFIQPFINFFQLFQRKTNANL